MHISKSISTSLVMALTLVCTTAARGQEIAPAASGGVMTRLYLASHGRASSGGDDRTLRWGPWEPETADNFSSDKAALEYTTPVLQRPVQVSGQVALEFYAASDARDANFTAAIADVQPDGSVVPLSSTPPGAIATPTSRTPGNVQLYRIDLGAVAHAFPPGHRIRVEISSNAANAANQRILHGVAHPSALVLHVTD